MARSVIFHGVSLAWFSFLVLLQSQSCAILRWWLSSGTIFMWLCTASAKWVGSTIVYGKVGVICVEFMD
jgi:hypothetical protein